ncbi:hypothetical protein MTR_2g076420 [Medicago truncatula]|uniref:Uncharacterized protein n=1 Tax=Medicago truncatula TaxID=3880 RepID=G7IH52_MEDTR|nr:hypothetical protein MTR_2g076420 [Medicago truncatula]
MCLRDEFDMPMEAKTIWLQPIMSTDIIEALGLLEIGSILVRCGVTLPDIFNNSYVEFSMRENNMVVHNLPKTAIDNVYSHIYFDIHDYSIRWIFVSKCTLVNLNFHVFLLV